MKPPTFRSWPAGLVFGVMLLVMAACSSATPIPPPGGPEFSAILVTQDQAVGINRVSFGLIDRNNMPVRTPDAQVQAVYFPPGKTEGEVRHTASARFLLWPPSGQRGVYVTTIEFDVAGQGTGPQDGLWELRITTSTADGAPVEAKTAVRVAEKSSTPAIGDPAPASVTPTAQDVEDLSTITSANPPDPDLYQLSIDRALETGLPLVVVFATPAFCVSATCGPQVEVLSQVKEGHRGEANFIHVEVFENPHLIQGGRPVGGVVPAVDEWGMLTEPWTFVIDKDGLVRAKFEQFTPAEEIEAALSDLP